jgi:hypothetical protein
METSANRCGYACDDDMSTFTFTLTLLLLGTIAAVQTDNPMLG